MPFKFNPLTGCLDLINTSTGGGGGGSHNSLTGLQGGTTGEYYHLTSAQYTKVQNLGTISSKNITISTDTPSGAGNTGDLWLRI